MDRYRDKVGGGVCRNKAEKCEDVFKPFIQINGSHNQIMGGLIYHYDQLFGKFLSIFDAIAVWLVVFADKSNNIGCSVTFG